jgi:hypothetical protein
MSIVSENSPKSDSRVMSPKRVTRSGSQDSVGSTHSDISHDRLRFHGGMKQLQDRHGGSFCWCIETTIK